MLNVCLCDLLLTPNSSASLASSHQVYTSWGTGPYFNILSLQLQSAGNATYDVPYGVTLEGSYTSMDKAWNWYPVLGAVQDGMIVGTVNQVHSTLMARLQRCQANAVLVYGRLRWQMMFTEYFKGTLSQHEGSRFTFCSIIRSIGL